MKEKFLVFSIYYFLLFLFDMENDIDYFTYIWYGTSLFFYVWYLIECYEESKEIY